MKKRKNAINNILLDTKYGELVFDKAIIESKEELFLFACSKKKKNNYKTEIYRAWYAEDRVIYDIMSPIWSQSFYSEKDYKNNLLIEILTVIAFTKNLNKPKELVEAFGGKIYDYEHR